MPDGRRSSSWLPISAGRRRQLDGWTSLPRCLVGCAQGSGFRDQGGGADLLGRSDCGWTAMSRDTYTGTSLPRCLVGCAQGSGLGDQHASANPIGASLDRLRWLEVYPTRCWADVGAWVARRIADRAFSLACSASYRRFWQTRSNPEPFNGST